jgi:tRNA (guanine-N7-)-methyltransferase
VISLAEKSPAALDSNVERLDLEKIFGRIAPLHVDLGCGDGSFLCALAAENPEKNALGIERQLRRVMTSSRKASALANVRVLHTEIAYAVANLLPPNSVAVFYLLFPDPWPKRRHHRRRLVTPEFLGSIRCALEPDGVLHIATDHLNYFQHITRLVRTLAQSAAPELDRLNRSSLQGAARQLDCLIQSSCETFEVIVGCDLELPLTKFEKRFRTQGASIYRLTLRKVSPVT